MHIVRLRLPAEGMQRTCAILRIHELCNWLSGAFNVTAKDHPETADVWRIELRGNPDRAWTDIVGELSSRLENVSVV